MKTTLATLMLALAAAQPALAQDIVIGQSVALSGSNADIGRDMRDGALAIFAKVNASNVLGRKIQLVTLDDANNRQRATEKRGAKLEQASIDAVSKDAPHYVLATTQYSVVSDYLKAVSDKGSPIPVAALSFVNPDELADSVGPLARGTVVSQVMPSPRASNQVAMPLVEECAEALNALNGAKLNCTLLESCIAAKTLVALLKKAGPKPTRDSVLAAMGTLRRVDLGGFALNCALGSHNGSSWVELTILSRGNRFVQ